MNEPVLICCGERVRLGLVGGQYQSTWTGECLRCGRKWIVEAENSDEEGD